LFVFVVYVIFLFLGAARQVFPTTPHVDYSSKPGGKAGPYKEVRGWLAKVMTAFPVTQHSWPHRRQLDR